MGDRFLLRRARWLQPLLFIAGLTRDANSYVEIEDNVLKVRFGWFFNHAIPLSDIESVGLTRWPWYYGLGWRANFSGLVGLVASYQGVVEVRLRSRHRVQGILPFVRVPCDRLAVSLDEPEGFIAALQRSID